MLEWLKKTHGDTAKRLKAAQIEAYRLEGGLAALEAVIQQARKEAQAGSGNGAAPAPASAPAYPHLATPKTVAPAITGIVKAVRVPVGPVQAEDELRE